MKLLFKFILAAILIIFTVVVGNFYGFIFAKTVRGELIDAQRLHIDMALMTSQDKDSAKIPSQLYSFAVAIKDIDGEIYTSSSEDRQWAVAQKGMCVEAKYYPYPPWNLDKSGTYHNARLLRMGDCPLK